MNKKITSILFSLIFSFGLLNASAPPDEGMWLPLLIKKLNYGKMKEMGCKLTPEDIYSINNSSLKDAVVQLGSFCTAEVVSSQGLLFTNHHCAYDAIQSHSSTEHDYLTDGFWSQSFQEELPVEGLTVSFLVRMEDVTEKVNIAAKSVPEEEREAKIEETILQIENEASNDGQYRAEVEAMYLGNEYYLFVYNTFSDIRLVGAPPSAIGKFGGDTDNWMWPRHTGDFAILRIYADADNNPAPYSEDNKPYKPKKYLPVSIKGLQEGDFSMIMGYPGSTDRYLTSYAIDHAYKNSNPDYIKILGERLSIMKAEMDADDAVRIALASDYASLANSYKYFKGQNNTLRNRNLQAEKREQEEKFKSWISKESDRKEEYGNVLTQIKQNYEQSEDILELNNYINMAGFGPKMANWGIQLYRLQKTMQKEDVKDEEWQPLVEMIRASLDGSFEDYYASVDEKIFAGMNRLMFNDLPKENHPSVYTSKAFTKAKVKDGQDRFDAYAAKVYESSILADREKMEAFLAKPSLKALNKDLGMQYLNSIIELYRSKLGMGVSLFYAQNEELMKSYFAGMREMNPNKVYYPDANFTMRLTYGKIIPYDPRDAVSYKAFTYADGIMEKDIPGDEEFDVPEKLEQLINAKDYGRYGENGKLNVCFLTNHDITGGNSGSPVIDGSGNLIGIAFDGNWESMASDLVFDDDVVRTISVDIRYVLFIIDKYAGAKRLINELEIIE